MEQVKGKISIGGNNSGYESKIAVLSNHSIFTLTNVDYRVYLFMSSGDRASGRITVGNYQTPMLYFSYGNNQYVVSETQQLIDSYKMFGINALSPYTFSSSWTGEQAVQFSIAADCNVFPTIANITSAGEYNLDNIVLNWESEHQDKYTITATVNNTVKYIATGTTEKTHTIPPNTFKDNDKVNIEIKIEYTHDNKLTVNAYAKENININIKNSAPEIIEISTNNINVDISKYINWNSQRQERYKLELNGKTYTGTTDTNCLVDITALIWGTNNAKLTLYNTVNNIQAETSKDFSFNVTANNPTVTALDPSDIDVNIDKPVIITWNTIPEQQEFILKANNNIYTGTNQMGITIPAGVFKTLENTINVIAKRHILGQILTGERTVKFIGYGKPNEPILDNKVYYNQAMPTFHWISEEQTAYQVQIYENSILIVDSNEIITNNKYYSVTNALKNNTVYTLKVRIKNRYNIWSDYTQKQITTSFETIASPEISLFEDSDGGIIINTTNQENSRFGRSEVWRKDDYSNWKRIGYNLPLTSSFKDNTIASNIKYYYKAITYTQLGGASESEVKIHKIQINEPFIVNIENNKSIDLGYSFSETQDIKIKRIQDRKVVYYQGKNAPELEIGEEDYKEIQINLAFKTYTQFKEFEYFIDSAKLLMFKDTLGRKIYCSLKSWSEEQSNVFGFITTTITLVEVNFMEQDVYDGGRILRLIRLDEGWKFDAGVALDMNVYDD